MTGFWLTFRRMSPISRGFVGKRPSTDPKRLPPGQYVTTDFPVLSAGPTPRSPLTEWRFTIRGAVAQSKTWTWSEFTAIPPETIKTDIHCVTKWSKFGTSWEGVSIDTLLAEAAKKGVEPSAYVMATSDGGYTTNVPLSDLTTGKAWIAFSYDGKPLAPEHGGPARLLVPRLYFWKSAKWVRGIELLRHDVPGFWEVNGYNNYGDPWKEQRYQGD